MATINAKYLTIADWASRTDPDGNIDFIVELMKENRPVMEDALIMEGNLPTGHQGTVRTGLPTPMWRRMYQGVPATKSQTERVVDVAGMLEDWATLDESVAELNGNSAAFRMSEDEAHLQGIAKEYESTFWYGNTDTEPETFMGMAPRFSSLSAPSGRNIVDGGGTGSTNTSIWFVTYGPRICHGFFPKASKFGGLRVRDLGLKRLFDANGDKYMGYETHFKFDTGLHVPNWKMQARIANLKADELVSGQLDAQLSEFMIKGYNSLEATFSPLFGGRNRTFCYMNRLVKTRLDIMQQSRAFGSTTQIGVGFEGGNQPIQLTPGQWAGQPVTMLWDVPIRVTDSLLNTEGTVS